MRLTFGILLMFQMTFCAVTKYPRIGDIDIMAPNLHEILQIAAEVFTTLGTASRESFTRKFFKMDPETVFNALKGVSLVGSVAAGTLAMPDENSTNLLKIVDEGLEQLAQKVYSLEELLFTSDIGSEEIALRALGVDINNMTINGVKHDFATVEFMKNEVWFKARVVFPANRTTHSMMAFKNDNSSVNRDKFLDYAGKDSWESYIIANGMDLLKSKIDSTRFNKTIFDELCGNLTIYYFQSYVVDFFQIGVEMYNWKYVEQQEFEYSGFFNQSRRDHLEVIQEASSYYYNNYFPGVIRQDIVRPTIANIGGDNCNIALNIVNQLNSRYPWRRYAVIVSDGVRQKDQFAYFGFPKRTIVDDDYNGKTAMIFMATKNFEKNRHSYLINNGRNQTITLIKNNFNSSADLNTALAFAKKGKSYFQMAAIKSVYNPCLPPLNTNISDAFDLKLKYGTAISVSVIF